LILDLDELVELVIVFKEEGPAESSSTKLRFVALRMKTLKIESSSWKNFTDSDRRLWKTSLSPWRGRGVAPNQYAS
jgi:hypothetical protein